MTPTEKLLNEDRQGESSGKKSPATENLVHDAIVIESESEVETELQTSGSKRKTETASMPATKQVDPTVAASLKPIKRQRTMTKKLQDCDEPEYVSLKKGYQNGGQSIKTEPNTSATKRSSNTKVEQRTQSKAGSSRESSNGHTKPSTSPQLENDGILACKICTASFKTLKEHNKHFNVQSGKSNFGNVK